MSKVITVLGGNGFIGSKCINTILNNVKDVKIYAISRTGKLKNSLESYDERVEHIKGDCLNPESFKDQIIQSTGIIHSIGVLFTNSNEKYDLMNKETCLRVAKIANESGKSPNFVYVSASRGIPFPLSLKYHGYIDSKRSCERELLNNYEKLNPIILRPGFVKSNEKSWTVPIYHSVNLVEFAERTLLNKISSKIGSSLELPSSGIEIEKLANFACAGALGKLKSKEIYNNDYMNNIENLIKL